MSVTIQEVEKIASLAKLEFSQEEKQRLAKEMDQIVTYIEKLNELDTKNVTPMYHVLDLKNNLREDEVVEWLTQNEALANAPAQKMGFFSVPKVITNPRKKTN